MTSFHKLMVATLFLALAGLSCRTLTNVQDTAVPAPTRQIAPSPTPAPTIMAPISAYQPFKISGSFKSSGELGGIFSDNILFSERQVILVDLHGFITRDKDWELPVNSQVIGHVQYDPKDASGTYTLLLPEVPQGTLNDVDNNGQPSTGVQVFVVDYEPNISGDPFKDGNDNLTGWPGNLASIKVSIDENHEVTGGKLVVYAPDGKQGFPTSFGADGKLFTGDDPVAILPAGYSIVDLDAKPFAFSRPAEAVLPLYEAADVGPKDYSKESYTRAFDELLKFLRTDYAFNGIPGKQPDWDKLAAAMRPRVEQAEKNADAAAFYGALRDFTFAFKDGHVHIDGGDFFSADFRENFSGGLGFTVRVLDDSRVLVNSVQAGSSAEAAGMKTGAILTQFNGKAVLDVIRAQPLFFGNQSSDASILFNQAIVLTRESPGAEVQVTFTNPGGQAKTTTLTARWEVDSLLAELGYNKSDALVPVDLRILTANGKDTGYIKLNTNSDDLNLILRLFERGLQKFSEQNIPGIIIDLRNNSGGVPLGLAGFLTNQEIPLGQIEYYDSVLGKFKARGTDRKISPMASQYHFDKIAVLVGLNCASACELEAYGFSKLPGAEVVGQYNSGGIEAEVSRGQVKMPAGIGLQFPTGRIVNPDGSLFLEGVGVKPTIKVPVNSANVLSGEDVILQTALDEISRN